MKQLSKLFLAVGLAGAVASLSIKDIAFAQSAAPAVVIPVASLHAPAVMGPGPAPVSGIVIPVVNPALGSPDDLNQFMLSIGGWSGMGLLGMVLIVIQGLMIALKGKLGAFEGKWQSVSILALSLISGVIALKMNGSSWGASLLHSSTLSLISAFASQVMSTASVPVAVDVAAPPAPPAA